MVYIEQVIFDNLLINSILLYLTVVIVKAKCARSRIFFSAIIGTSFAVVLPFVDKFIILYKLFALFSTTILLLNYKSFKSYLFVTLVFAMISFLLGGVAYGLFNFTITGRNNLIIYPTRSIFRLILIAIILIFYILRQIKHFYFKYNINTKNKASAEIILDDNTYNLNCFFDTGNQLYDEITLKPVVVLSNDIGVKHLNGNERLLNVKTVTSCKNLPVITIQQMKIHTKNGDNVYTKIPAVVSDNTYDNYKIILNCALSGGYYEQI